MKNTRYKPNTMELCHRSIRTQQRLKILYIQLATKLMNQTVWEIWGIYNQEYGLVQTNVLTMIPVNKNILIQFISMT